MHNFTTFKFSHIIRWRPPRETKHFTLAQHYGRQLFFYPFINSCRLTLPSFVSVNEKRHAGPNYAIRGPQVRLPIDTDVESHCCIATSSSLTLVFISRSLPSSFYPTISWSLYFFIILFSAILSSGSIKVGTDVSLYIRSLQRHLCGLTSFHTAIHIRGK